ncbi:hypothetical protein [Paenibacillus hexagrammi]|uniref:Uncharacterized protein n=1 Tax=Paenibacillus hexagrammi TaxID=2908839 RepID=A0ABY3SJE7_9BACL|nr:hypothetical protein [Paenibacillus sp. YPD9-1]UJF34177.1 hypothetical protein L0M14_02800 [Paenibacillus sp. YPD9-1]
MKKLAMMGLGVAVGSMMLVTSVYAGVGDAPGYEAFKSAFKNSASIDNATRQIHVTMQDNGVELLDVNTTIKYDREQSAASAKINVSDGTEQQELEFYNQDGQQIVKTGDSDVYKILDHEQGRGPFKHSSDDGAIGKHEPNPEVVKEVENVVDALVGNLKNYVTMNDAAGGGKDIHFELTGSQIPPVVNAIGSLMIKHHNDALAGGRALPPSESSNPWGMNPAMLKDRLPKLSEDVKMDTVEMNATVDADNHITNQSAQIHISGVDEAGVNHNVVVSMDMTLSGISSTQPDQVDLDGKQVEHVKVGERRFGNKE